MHSRPDPLCVYEHAINERDEILAAMFADRLFPWVRCIEDPSGLPKAAQQTFEHLCRNLRP
jgi:hypothetical protein